VRRDPQLTPNPADYVHTSERSSRSHSVFTLRISGKNVASGDTCEGSLNLVDLAGSERLEKSGAGNDKDRLKETQNINKSLSALGDVIAALGEKGDGKSDKHIPYRNSKVTLFCDCKHAGPLTEDVLADISLATFPEWKLENFDGVKPVALVRSHERVIVFFAVRHKGNPSQSSSLRPF
jgi:hypothetical protein